MSGAADRNVADIVSRLPSAPASHGDQPPAPPRLPDGLVLWEPSMRPPRPTLDALLFHGPIGRFAQAASAYTEADPVAIFAQALTAFGVAAHRSAHITAGNDRHAASLFSLIVGRSAKGGKGTAWAVVRELLARLDPGALERVVGGFGSGEAVIDELAPDDDDKPVRDSRALIFESEFGALLAQGRRDGSTVSATMRNLWDGRPLQSRTRSTGKRVAADYHAGGIGHITRQELRAKLTETDMFNGFVNRWLIWWVERGELQPDGGNVPTGLINDAARELASNLSNARRGVEMKRTPAANDLWRDVYYQLAADDPPGMLGLALNRSAPQCLRLSLTLALADGSDVITDDHVRAGHAAWTYCRASAARVFGETAGTPDADRLLIALRDAGSQGLDFSEQLALFSRRGSRAEHARAMLSDSRLAHTIATPTDGRPRSVTYAVVSMADRRP